MVGALLLSCLTAHASFSNRVNEAVAGLPGCLARFREYPPGPGKLGFPRCLFETPFPENPIFWLKNVDFSCASPWNDSFGRLRAGTAISKRHILFANHFPLSKGTRLAFVGVTGDVSHYSIKDTKRVVGTDMMIGLLDYELTPDVQPAKVLPANYEKWIVEGVKWPVVTLSQNEEAYLTELCYLRNDETGKKYLFNRVPTDPSWQKLRHKVRGGDSGNPAFLLYNGKLILLYCLWSGMAGGGDWIHDHRSNIQRTMDDLCPGYRLDDFDFAAAQNQIQ